MTMDGRQLGWMILMLVLGLIEYPKIVSSQVGQVGTTTNSSSTVDTDYWDDDDFVPYQGERFNIFDWNLCKNIAKKHSGNLLISPISIKLALVLLYEGAQDQTAQELANVMQLPVSRPATRDRFSNILQSLRTTHADYILNIGTRIYVDSSIPTRQRYGAIVKTFYDTDVVNANLSNTRSAADSINNWVSNITRGNIAKMIEDDNSIKDSLMLVMNALYFKGSWRYPFSLNSTQNGQFFTTVDKSNQVPFMNVIGHFYYSESPELDAKILRLPYLGHKYAMFLILPRTRGGLEQLAREINPFILTRYTWLMQDLPVDVSIPKFKFDFTSYLEPILRELGIRDIFDDTATLTGIARAKRASRRLVVSDILQKVGLEVNEQGTSAYAVTEVHIGNKMADQTFHANHPFLFYIEDESTGTVIFIGKVTNPLEASGHIGSANHHITTKINEKESAKVPSSVAPAAINGEERYNFFDVELFQGVINEVEDNVVVAPTSVKSALTTLVEGSGGQTYEELISVLRLPSDIPSIRAISRHNLSPFQNMRASTELILATRLWIGQNVNVITDYSNIIQRYYGGDFQILNFSNTAVSTNFVNDWVSQYTRGHVKTIVEPGQLNPNTRVLLTNVLYFKGNWLNSFDVTSTRLRCFYIPNYGCQQTYLMENLSTYRYAYISSLDADVVEIPYSDRRLSMLILLPKNDNSDLKTLSKDLAHTSISVLVNNLREDEVLLSLPRFTIESKLDLRPALERMGVKDLFDIHANLSGIVKDPVQVNNILHNAKIEVNEKGTIAAAATGAEVVPLIGSRAKTFTANRPFLFALVDLETNGILFAGRFVKPDIIRDSPEEGLQPQRF